MSLIAKQTPYRRGRLLALLRDANKNGMSVPLLRTTLNGWGYKADPDTIDIDISWLHRYELIERRKIAEVELLSITERGRAVVMGNLDFPGIELIED